jgi:exonuclease SbcC
MKPIYVKMSAFGSYAGEETVDFTDVDHGIFLITGDTGAGKTTIFDAITYALYDKTSGGKRDGEMMRSQYANEDNRTYVELKFNYQDDIYTIIRSPRQERISKRKNKDGELTRTIDAPSVELIMPDGMPYRGKIKETNQRIVDIIGLDVDQFTQIAMIAQGDFLKLLHAPSKERKEIFAKIFNTRIYWRIEEELKNRSKQSFGKLEDNRKDILREMENVRCVENSDLEGQWAETPHFLESDPDLQITLIRQIIKEAEAREKEIMLLIKENQNALSKVTLELQQAEGINQLFAALENACKVQEALNNRAEEMNSVKNKLDTARKALIIEPKEKAFLDKQNEHEACIRRIEEIKEWIDRNKPVLEELLRNNEEAESNYKNKTPELGAKISKIKEFLPKFLEYEDKSGELVKLIKNRDLAQKKLEDILTEIGRATQRHKAITEEQLAIRVVAEELPLLSQTVEKLTERKSNLEKLGMDIKELEKLKDSYVQKMQEVKCAEENWQEKSKNYESCYRQFIEGQAVILAHELKEGCPCPVCGSTEHPQKAVFTELGVTQKDLEIAKNSKEEADQELLKKREELHRNQQSYESKKVLAEHEGKRVITRDFSVETATGEDIQIALLECNSSLNIETTKKEQASTAKEKFSHNEEELQKLNHDLEVYTAKRESADLILKELEINRAASEKEIHLLKGTLIYESSAIAQQELSAADEQLKSLETIKGDTTKKYQSLLEQMNTTRGKLKSEEENLGRISNESNDLREAFDQEILKQGFPDKAFYHASLISSETIKTLDDTLQEFTKSVIENDNSIKHYTEQTAGKEKVDTSYLEVKKAGLLEAGISLDHTNKQVYGIRTGDERILENTLRLFELRRKTREEYMIISRLEATAIGKVGPKRLNFQTYIQRRYFNSILREANKRLYIMSNGQFILKCRDVEDLSNQGEVGLDLDVYSMVNDQIRDVKTLSGGESFMAALAMALGMADIIQNCAGSIHIDTMFIDEGFGSLSDETRMQAINVLNELSEGKRLVGIISHVSELKAQIGTKLNVTKTDKGSKVRWDIGD